MFVQMSIVVCFFLVNSLEDLVILFIFTLKSIFVFIGAMQSVFPLSHAVSLLPPSLDVC